jgi:hypothetical protein
MPMNPNTKKGVRGELSIDSLMHRGTLSRVRVDYLQTLDQTSFVVSQRPGGRGNNLKIVLCRARSHRGGCLCPARRTLPAEWPMARASITILAGI